VSNSKLNYNITLKDSLLVFFVNAPNDEASARSPEQDLKKKSFGLTIVTIDPGGHQLSSFGVKFDYYLTEDDELHLLLQACSCRCEADS
jgi:hypothetical protein